MPTLPALFLACSTLLQSPPHFTVTDVTPDIAGAEPIGGAALSDTGFATGWLTHSSGPLSDSSFLWSVGDRFLPSSTKIPPPPLGVAWTAFTGVAVNDAGTLIGLFGDIGGSFSLRRGYRFRAGVTEELLSPEGFQAIPRAINAGGEIVGLAGGPHPIRAVHWTSALVASFVTDGTLFLTQAMDISARGEIAGFHEDSAGKIRGYLYESGRLTPLGTLDPSDRGRVIPRALNAHGDVVGSSRVGAVERAFLWTKSGGMRELARFGDAAPAINIGLDISDDGWVLGQASKDGVGLVDVLWAPDGTRTEIAPLVLDSGPGGRWSRLFGTFQRNQAGQILGWCLRPNNIDLRFTLLTPARLTLTALDVPRAGQTHGLEVTGAEPGRALFLAGDLDPGDERGYHVLPGQEPLGLSMQHPRVVARARADGAGRAQFVWDIPASLAGTALKLQAFQLRNASLSGVVHETP